MAGRRAAHGRRRRLHLQPASSTRGSRAYIQYLTGVTSVTAPDDATLVITSRRPNAGMLALAIPILPEHVWAKVDPDRLGEFGNLPFVGLGPVPRGERRAGRRVAAGGQPATTRPRSAARPASTPSPSSPATTRTRSPMLYRSGELDAVVDFPATYEQRLRRHAGDVDAWPLRPSASTSSAFNCWHSPRSKGDPLLRDASIRQAVHWAIDKRQIAATAMAGLAVPATSLISPAQADWRWDVPADAAVPLRPAAREADPRRRRLQRPRRRRRARGRGRSRAVVPARRARRVPGGPDRGTHDRRLVPRRGHPPAARAAWTSAAFSDAIFDDADYDLFVWSWGGDVDPGFILEHLHRRPQIMGWSDSQYSDPDYDRLCRAPGAGARSRAPRRHHPAQGAHRRRCRRSCTATTRTWSSGTT